MADIQNVPMQQRSMSSSSYNDQDEDRIDLKKVIEQHTWKIFKESKGFWRRLLFSKKKHYVKIPWEYLHFEHKTEWKLRPEQLKTKTVDLYQCDYENKTSNDQKYIFSATRETSSSASVQLQGTFTLAGSLNLEINLGSFGKLSGGFSPSLSVQKTSGETFEDGRTWAINAEVLVEPWHKVIAYLRVSELNNVYSFEVKTTLSLPQGHLPVTIRRKSDDKYVWGTWLISLPEIFDDKCKAKYKKNRIDDNQSMNNITFTTYGVSKIVFWTEQQVEVESHEIQNEAKPIGNASNQENKED